MSVYILVTANGAIYKTQQSKTLICINFYQIHIGYYHKIRYL